MQPTPRAHFRPISISLDEQFGEMPFVLSAEALRKISEIILFRSDGEVEFEVAYQDGTETVGLDLDAVVADDNSALRPIRKIKCNFSSTGASWDDRDRISIKFEDGWSTPVALSVSSPNRDRVWLTVQDLRDYIGHEVVRKPLIPKFWVELAFCLVTVFSCMLILRMGWIPGVRRPDLDELLKSVDVNAKLNFLLQLETRSFEGGASAKTLAAALMVGLVGCYLWFRFDVYGVLLPTAMFPRNYFTLGKGEDRYRNRTRLKNQLFWVVLVGLAVSTVAGFIVLFLTPGSK